MLAELRDHEDPDGIVPDLLDLGPAALRREGGPRHLTASAILFDAEGSHVLLRHHAGLDAWGHLGGHLEPEDAALAEAAERECREESGFTVAVQRPAELRRHHLDLPRCREHLDVLYALRIETDPAADLPAGCRWFRVDDLPLGILPDIPARLPTLLAAAMAGPLSDPPATADPR